MQHFPDAGRRDVVIVGSTGALTPMRGVGIYAASKRGLEAAFDTLRLELAHRGVNVGLVMPGMFDTEGLTMEGLVFDGEIPDVDIPYFVSDGAPAGPRAPGRVHRLHASVVPKASASTRWSYAPRGSSTPDFHRRPAGSALAAAAAVRLHRLTGVARLPEHPTGPDAGGVRAGLARLS